MFLPRLSNKKWTLSFAVVSLVAVVFTLTGMKSYQPHQAYIMQGASKGSMISLVNDLGGEVVHDFAVIPAISAMLTDEQVSAIRKTNPLIRLFSDAKVKLDGKSDEWHNKKPLSFKVNKSKVVWAAKNRTDDSAFVESLSLSWPTDNGFLKNLKVNGNKVAKNIDVNDYTYYFDESIEVSSGEKFKVAMKFDTLSSVKDFDYSISLNLTDGSSVELDSVKQNVTRSEQRDTFFPSQVNADKLHEMGITGRGVGVAVIDSGLSNFEQLEYNSFGEKRQIQRMSVVGGLKDKFGHGTHVTSLIANSEASYDENGNLTGSYNGIAPDVNLFSVKAFDKKGNSSYSGIIQAIAYVIENKDEYNIKVLNISFGADVQSLYFYDPINVALMAAWDAGITVVASAGNTGPDGMSVGVPGNNPYVITVGATSDNYTPFDTTDDFVASFSSSGPTHAGFLKPEIVAPGAHMQGLMSEKSTLFKDYSMYDDNNGYFLLSGTSQATAVTSGIVALMLQDQPHLTPDDVKCRLIDSASLATKTDGTLGFSIFRQGAGMVDAYSAVMSQASNCANQGMDVRKSVLAEEVYHGPARWNPDTEEFYVEGHEGLNWNGLADLELIGTNTFIWPPGNGSGPKPSTFIWPPGNGSGPKPSTFIWPPGNGSGPKPSTFIWPPGNGSGPKPSTFIWPPGNGSGPKPSTFIWPPGNGSGPKPSTFIWPPGNGSGPKPSTFIWPPGNGSGPKPSTFIWPPGNGSGPKPSSFITTSWIEQE